jgi:formylglycine-generating enzyme required for sulfatase activity
MALTGRARLGALALAAASGCGGLVARENGRDAGREAEAAGICAQGEACCDGSCRANGGDGSAPDSDEDGATSSTSDGGDATTRGDARTEDAAVDGTSDASDASPDSTAGGRPAPSSPYASCAPGGPGMTDCGPDGGESCCTSLEVEGGAFYRTFTWDGGPTGEADPVTVSSFRLDKYLVTVGRFRQFVDAWDGGAGYTPLEGAGKHAYLNGGNGLRDVGTDAGTVYEPGWIRSDYGLSPTDANLQCAGASDNSTWTPAPGENENLPIACANWFDAYAFCIWDGGFLPSEAEWAYAAAGGSEQRQYPWGSTYPDGGIAYAIAECAYPSGVPVDCGYQKTNLVSYVAPVGTATLGVARWGQLDMAGLADEWTLDWTAAYVAGCQDCAWLTITLQSNRVCRGGDWFEPPWDLLTTYRTQASPVARGITVGFRCARPP